MKTLEPARPARFHATRTSLYLGVAMALGLLASPSRAQTASSDPQAENAALKKEVEALRQQLAALGQHPKLDDTAAASVLVTTTPVRSEVRPADDQADKRDILVKGARKPAPSDGLTALREVPKAISVVTPAELKIFDEVSLPDALSRLGNVRWNDGNARTGSFSMRGLTASAGSDTIDPSVGITVDGVPYASLALADLTDTLDIEQINVVKGPQGTTGARQTSVGQINIVNRLPSFKSDFSATVTVGQNDALRTEFEGGGTIIDDLLAFRITASRDVRQGNWWNQYVDVKGYESFPKVDRTYGRIQLLVTPASNLSIRLKYDISPNGGEYSNGLSFYKLTPHNYANGAAYDATTTPLAKLSRSWFTQQTAIQASSYYGANPTLNANLPITTGGHGALADVEWNLGKHTLSFVSSFNNSYFLAGNDDGTPFDISSDGGYITTYEQFTEEAKLKGKLFNDKIDYTAGLFFLESDSRSLMRTGRYGSDAGAYQTTAAQYNALSTTSAGNLLMENSLDRLYIGDQSYLHYISKAAFAQVDWHATDKLTFTAGGRFTREKRELSEGKTLLDEGYGSLLDPVSSGNVQLGGGTANNNAIAQQYFGTSYANLTTAQQNQITQARAVRSSTIGTLYQLTKAKPWEGNLYTGQLSGRYDFTQNLNGYATLQYGEKPGLPVFLALSSGPEQFLVAKERTLTYEVGTRANLFDGKLVVNADLYRAEIWNFQQSVYVLDPVQTAVNNTSVYTSITGNVPKVRTQGLETQIQYNGIKYTNLSLNGAYTDAKYVTYTNAGQPSENGNLATKYRDISGYTLPNAPRFQFNATASYRRPVLDNLLLHGSAGFTFTSRQNVDAALSSYGWTHAYGITDLSLGIGRRDERFDINLIVRNLFDVKREDQGWSTITVYQKPRWIGVSLTGKFS